MGINQCLCDSVFLLDLDSLSVFCVFCLFYRHILDVFCSVIVSFITRVCVCVCMCVAVAVCVCGCRSEQAPEAGHEESVVVPGLHADRWDARHGQDHHHMHPGERPNQPTCQLGAVPSAPSVFLSPLTSKPQTALYIFLFVYIFFISLGNNEKLFHCRSSYHFNF